jgi:hypothetical protein
MAKPFRLTKSILDDTLLGVLIHTLVRDAISMNSVALRQSTPHRLALGLWYTAEGHKGYDEMFLAENALLMIQRAASKEFNVPIPERAPWQMTAAEYRFRVIDRQNQGKDGQRELRAEWADLAAWVREHALVCPGIVPEEIEAGTGWPLIHKAEVIRALSVGRPVPAHALDSYPDLSEAPPVPVPSVVLPSDLARTFERICEEHLASYAPTSGPSTIAEMRERLDVLRVLAAAMRGLGAQWWLAETELHTQVDTLEGNLRAAQECGG